MVPGRNQNKKGRYTKMKKAEMMALKYDFEMLWSLANDTVRDLVKRRIVFFSEGNSKMGGSFASVSLMHVATCPENVPCKAFCYCNGDGFKEWTIQHRIQNTLVYMLDPVAFFEAVNAKMETVDRFRFHVAGDCPDLDYTRRTFEAVVNHPKCRTNIFTKQYTFWNAVLAENGFEHWNDVKTAIPNLFLKYSECPGFDMDNPAGVPVARVLFRRSQFEACSVICHGDCDECEKRGLRGCFNISENEILGLPIHGNGRKVKEDL